MCPENRKAKNLGFSLEKTEPLPELLSQSWLTVDLVAFSLVAQALVHTVGMSTMVILEEYLYLTPTAM